MRENQQYWQHAQRISTVAALSDDVEDFGFDHEIIRSWQRCLNDGQKDEHFLSQNIHLTCSAAPIFDPHGQLLSVLDASSCYSADSRSSQ